MGWTDFPALHQSAQGQGRCNDPAVDVSPDKFGFDELPSECAMHPIDDPRLEDEVRQELQTRHSH
jgi:hypothetical protein